MSQKNLKNGNIYYQLADQKLNKTDDPLLSTNPLVTYLFQIDDKTRGHPMYSDIDLVSWKCATDKKRLSFRFHIGSKF